MVRRVACAMLVALVTVIAAAGSALAAYQQLFFRVVSGWCTIGRCNLVLLRKLSQPYGLEPVARCERAHTAPKYCLN